MNFFRFAYVLSSAAVKARSTYIKGDNWRESILSDHDQFIIILTDIDFIFMAISRVSALRYVHIVLAHLAHLTHIGELILRWLLIRLSVSQA